MSRILDPKFQYTPADKTDLRKTFKREKKRLAEERRATEAKVAQINAPNTKRRTG